MNSVVDTIGTFTGIIIDTLLLPFRSASPEWALFIVSAVIGVVFLLIFGRVSNQARIREIKTSISAAFLEAILFRHDLLASLRAQGAMAWGGLRYFCLAVPPILVLLIPSIFILAQLNLRYGHRELQVGKPTIFGVRLETPEQLYRISLQSPVDGLEISPPLRIKESKEILWRITPLAPGSRELSIKLGDSGKELKTSIISGETRPAVIQSRVASSWVSKLLYPGSELNGLKGFVAEHWIEYPERSIKIFGVSMHWVIFFFCISLLSGIVASRYLKIEI